VAPGWQVLNVLNVWNQPEVQKNTLKLRSERIPRVPKKGGAGRIQNGDERSGQVQFQQYLASRDINAEKYSSF
jgi:hypothetical protein